jgi:hypothetical protein
MAVFRDKLYEMTDKSCLDACQNSFQATVNRLNDTLFDALIQANGDENLEKRAKENFVHRFRFG